MLDTNESPYWTDVEGGDELQKFVSGQMVESDVWFTSSPDAGMDCLCSRCGKAITGTVLRIFDDGRERRYHCECLGVNEATEEA